MELLILLMENVFYMTLMLKLEFFQTGKYMLVKSLKHINNEWCVALAVDLLLRKPIHI
jgi:hypothetical protein